MELVARILITVKNDRWNSWLEDEQPNAIKLDFENYINKRLNPRYSDVPEWDKAEFVEWEEQKGDD